MKNSCQILNDGKDGYEKRMKKNVKIYHLYGGSFKVVFSLNDLL